MTKFFATAAVTICLLVSNAQASNLTQQVRVEALTMAHVGLKVTHSMLSNTRPAIRFVNVLIPVDMSSFKAKATKESKKLDAKVLKLDTEVQAMRQDARNKVAAAKLEKSDGVMPSRSLPKPKDIEEL